MRRNPAHNLAAARREFPRSFRQCAAHSNTERRRDNSLICHASSSHLDATPCAIFEALTPSDSSFDVILLRATSQTSRVSQTSQRATTRKRPTTKRKRRGTKKTKGEEEATHTFERLVWLNFSLARFYAVGVVFHFQSSALYVCVIVFTCAVYDDDACARHHRRPVAHCRRRRRRRRRRWRSPTPLWIAIVSCDHW